jgi:hypothetical protein
MSNGTVLRFDRHELFNGDMLREHSELIEDVMGWGVENDQRFDTLLNYLYGVYDGFFYSDIAELAEELPEHLCTKVIDLYNLLNELVVESTFVDRSLQRELRG